MNKEIEELLNDMSKVYEAHVKIIDKYNNADEIHYASPISLKQVNLLLSYIEQLENNRDKAIEYVKKHTYHDTPKYNGTRIMTQGCLIATNDFWYEDLLDILKGDSDE